MTSSPTSHSPSLVGLTGYAGTGKSKVSDVLYTRYRFRTFSLEDNVREALLALDPMLTSERSLNDLVNSVGWDGAKSHRVHGPEVRRLLQAMGTEVGRTFFGDEVWTNLLSEDIGAAGGHTRGKPVAVDDIHSDNEARWVHELGGQVWQLVNPTAAGPMNRHSTELPITPDLVDHTIVFDGDVPSLTRQIDQILFPNSDASFKAEEAAA